MMVRRCDRCGQEQDAEHDLFYGLTIAPPDGNIINCDLCKNCGDMVMAIITVNNVEETEE